MAARDTYFITTPRMFGMLDKIIITFISTISEIIVLFNPMKNAGITLLKFSGWLTAYFIIFIPPLTSFSTLMCIIIDATNLATIMSRDSAGLTTNSSFSHAYFQTQRIIMICTIWTIREFMNTSDCYSAERSRPNWSFLIKTAYPIAVESAVSLKFMTLGSTTL